MAVAFAALTLGGSSKSYPYLDLVVQAFAIGGICVAIGCGWWTCALQLPVSVRLLVLSVVLLPLIFIIPLPPAIVEGLPGRGLSVEVWKAIGTTREWHTASLVPDATMQAFLALSCPAAAFLLTLALPGSSLRAVLAAILVIILCSAVIGMFQVASDGALFPFYGNFYRGSSNGLLANRNHHADFLTVGVLILTIWWSPGRGPRVPLPVIGGLAAFLIAGILATQSRAGLVIALFALSIQAAYIMRPTQRSLVAVGLAVIVMCVLAVGIYAFSSRVQGAVARFTFLTDDPRFVLWRNSWDAIKAYFPLGSGVATFDDVYLVHERLELLRPTKANAAHNDYIELLVTSGLLGMAVLGWLIACVLRALRAFRYSNVSLERRNMMFVACMTCVVLLLHSFADYPLQTASLSFLFTMFLALIMRLSYFEPEQRQADGKSRYRSRNSLMSADHPRAI